ncbi:MAG: 3-phosphoshikimate 1-carboxyvinyltransferase [Candidatus Omnitrophica bacterium]|nr:3-phosphoshikimate 1-carboxyvinyltransferase [Candidatus Omnitrophota bacterium]MDD5660960.1 3-phosphoshikimate 1-carboxyvinyltransferase [Candidatus Omnitrophota bacterium]
MKPLLIKNKFVPRGKVIICGDKSIAHRALILSALSSGKTILKNFPIHDDSYATMSALGALGVKILRKRHNQVLVFGKGLRGLVSCRKPVFVGDSGTTLRLLLGVLAGQDFKTKVIAGKSLSLRPMARVSLPLRLMGAKISSKVKGNEEYAPITIQGGSLKGIIYRLPVSSAQVKSAILLAGLFAKGRTCVIEKTATRDHTERMLRIFGADLVTKGKSVYLNPGKDLTSPGEIYIPADISSAAFFLVLALVIPGSRITIRRIGLNPGRCGLIDVLKRMQAKIKVSYSKGNKTQCAEPVGDLSVCASKLKGRVVYPDEVPSLIDELPILMVAACFAQGITIIKGAQELKVKETDRIKSMVSNLKKMGADIKVDKLSSDESIIIKGKGRLSGANLKSFGDHRTAMSVVIAALAAAGESRIDDISCISKSFPGFLTVLNGLSRS